MLCKESSAWGGRQLNVSMEIQMAINYEFNEELAQRGDSAASRLDTGPVVGVFKRAWAVQSENTGTHGVELEFEEPSGGKATTTLWTQREDGTPVFGQSLLQAAMYLMGVKSLKSEPGKIEKYDEDAKGRVEVDGDTYPALCNKPIGVVWQKELYSKNNGSDGDRLNIVMFYQPETKLTMTELKERVTKPQKLEKLLKTLKVKDTRKKSAEPAQPSIGGAALGDF